MTDTPGVTAARANVKQASIDLARRLAELDAAHARVDRAEVWHRRLLDALGVAVSWSVPCPVCGAPVDQPCEDADGVPFSRTTHTRRETAVHQRSEP